MKNSGITASNILGNFIKKDLTFSNDSAAIDLFTVTGSVIVKIIAECTTNVASAAAGNIEVGISGSTSSIITTTTATDLADNEIWHDASPDASIEALSVIKEFIITNSNDVILTPSAQIDSGAVTFYCWWVPLSQGASVVAA